MTYLIADIETCQHPDAQQWVDPVLPDARLKDPKKIEDSIKEKTAERDERLGLDPDMNVIVALGYHVVGRSDPCCVVMSNEFEEREHLIQFRDLYLDLDRRNEVRMVTFYGHKFDLPVLMRRAMYLDVPNFPEFNLDRYRSPHIDVYERLTYRGAINAHSLKFYAKRLGFTTLDKVDGAQVPQLVKEGKWDEIEAHCLSDVSLTHALSNRLGLLKIGTVAAK